MDIRIAKRDDLPAMVEIYNQAVTVGRRTADTEPLTVEDRGSWFDEHDPDQYPIWVAEENSQLLGYLSLSAYRCGRQALRHTAEASYYVHADCRKKGVATALLQHAIDACRALQIRTVFAIVIDGNLPSIRLLEKFHFERWGFLPRVAEFNGLEYGHIYYGRRVDED